MSVCHSNWRLLIAASSIPGGYYSAPIFFYNSKNLNCIGVLCFYDSKRTIGEVLFTTRRGVLEKSFFNQFYWSDFFSGKWNAWNILEWLWCWTKVKSGAKREWFLFIPLFLREREIDVWKIFLWASEIFLITCGILKQFFSFILVKRFGYDFGFNFWLISVVVWRFLELHMNFMIIRRFLMYFADFRANFVFFTIILIYWLKWVLKKALLLEQFFYSNWLQFCG